MCRPARRPADAIERWREHWERAAREFDPDFERRGKARRDEAARRSNERLRRLAEDIEREQRENDPTVN